MEVRKVTKGVESNMVAFDFEHTPITQIADYIIITASRNNVSDIHFDPRVARLYKYSKTLRKNPNYSSKTFSWNEYYRITFTSRWCYKR